MKPCKTCSYRWFNKALWYCRTSTIAKAKLIGNESELKSAKGCSEWK